MVELIGIPIESDRRAFEVLAALRRLEAEYARRGAPCRARRPAACPRSVATGGTLHLGARGAADGLAAPDPGRRLLWSAARPGRLSRARRPGESPPTAAEIAVLATENGVWTAARPGPLGWRVTRSARSRTTRNAVVPVPAVTSTDCRLDREHLPALGAVPVSGDHCTSDPDILRADDGCGAATGDQRHERRS